MRFQSPLQTPLSSGLLSERRAAQGCSVWQEHAVLACPRKCHVHCQEGSATAYEGVAQYSGNFVCDETQKLRHLLCCQQTSQVPLELRCFQGEMQESIQQGCASLSEGVHWTPMAATLGQGGKKPLILWLLSVPWQFWWFAGVCFCTLGLFLYFPIYLQMRGAVAALHPLCWLKPHVQLGKVTTDWLSFHLVGLATSTPVILESLYINNFHLLNFESYIFQLFPHRLHRKYHNFA